MVELADGRPDAALTTLAPLRPYVQTCARHIDGIHLRVLCAIALFRKRDESWRQELTQALDAAAEFRFHPHRQRLWRGGAAPCWSSWSERAAPGGTSA
ncbi:MAG: hypothetical protein V8S34_03100 [Lawsonibacter sp.]